MSLKNNFTQYQSFSQLLTGAKSKRASIEKEFFGVARDFIIETLELMKEVLPLDDDILNSTSVVFLQEHRFNIDPWRKLGVKFNHLLATEKERFELEEDLSRLKIQYPTQKRKADNCTNFSVFWADLSKSSLKLLGRISKVILCLPYSTALVEACFSKFKVIKTPQRNRINVENIEVSIITEQECGSTQPPITPKMFEKYRNLWNQAEGSNKHKQSVNEQTKEEVKQGETQNSDNINQESKEPEIQVTNKMDIEAELNRKWNTFINSLKSFLVCGISNMLDGSQDHLVHNFSYLEKKQVRSTQKKEK